MRHNFISNYAYDYWGWYPFIQHCLLFVTSLIQILEKCFYNILIEFHVSLRLVIVITTCLHIRTAKHVSDAFLAQNIFPSWQSKRLQFQTTWICKSFSRSQNSIKNTENERSPLLEPTFRSQPSTFYSTSWGYTAIFSSHLYTRRSSKYLPFRCFNHNSVCMWSLPHALHFLPIIIMYLIVRIMLCKLHNCQLFEDSSTHALTLTTDWLTRCSFYAFTFHSSLSELNRAIVLSYPHRWSLSVC
jgi:hypothetical protein